MLPLLNPPSFRPNQVQAGGAAATSSAQQVIPNNCHGNPSNLYPNSPQFQSQMGMRNPSIPTPFNNSNVHMPTANGISATTAAQQVPANNCQGNPPSLFPSSSQIQSQIGMLNPFIPFAFNNSSTPMSNGYGMPIMGQPQMGFMTPMSINQPLNPFFSPNCMNSVPMYFNQNVGFPIQNVNHFVQRPLSNYNQVGPCNMPVYPNQVSQALGPQNPTFIQNAQFCPVPTNAVMQPNIQNQQNLVHNTAQLPQGNNTVRPTFQSAPPQQSQKDFCPPVSNMSQLQGNLGNHNRVNGSQAKWNDHQNRNFSKNLQRDALHRGFPTNKMQNVKGTLRSHNKHRVKGYKIEGGQKPEFANSINQTPVQQRSYTAQEIQQWREERRKNYPSTANTEKKLKANTTEPDVSDRSAQLRRQRLKEILEKQAELGCEVAEIPSYYLSDSEKQVHRKEENERAFSKRERFQNNKKFNKRGRSRQNDRFAKKQKFAENESPNNVHNQHERLHINKREPTLLQKLLSADIRRDKSHLLQVFRFMVMNSFFRDLPQKPLRFPLAMVKEIGAESEVVEGKSISENGVLETKDRIAVEESNYVNDNDDGDNNDDSNENDYGKNRNEEVDDKTAYSGGLKCSAAGDDQDVPEEEEGEIID